MALIEINNASFYYETHGEGQPLILISGFGCDHSFWTFLTEFLTPHFKILLLDNRGSGQTKDDNHQITLPIMADDVLHLANHLGLKNPHIVGHSMGGAIALHAAIRYPEQIGKLIIFNSSAKFNAISSLALNTLIKLQKTTTDIDLILESFMPWVFSEDFLANPSLVENYKQLVKSYSFPQTLEGNSRQVEALNAYDARSLLNKIRSETLIVGTNRDLLVSADETQNLAKNIKNAQLQMLPGSHSIIAETPKIAADVIMNFL